ncbi:TetR/AcrR family transcriptional regulator, partial [Cellulomonas septica]|nr:TetR/AcrR family transcriptional regulator [Cellulomonas septica]
MTEHTGTGDPARSMALLWRTAEPAAPRGRGAAAGLSVDRVVATAVAL